MIKKLSIGAASVIIWLVCAPAQALLIELVPSSASVVVNEEFTVDVMVGDLLGEIIGGYETNVDYDSGALGYETTLFDTFLDAPDSLQEVTPGIGSVDVSEVSLGFLLNQDGFTDFRIFSMSFTALSAGVAEISLSNLVLGDFFGNPLAADFLGAQITITDSVAAVPAPPALILFLSGLLGMYGIRRRQRTPS